MRKSMRRLFALSCSACMLVPNITMPAAAAQNEYVIYPTPQSVAYGTNTVDANDVNVVYGTEIDSFTKDHLEDVFSLLNGHVTVSEAASEDKTNVYVGTKGDGSLADTYFETAGTIEAADLFNETDAYALEVEDGVIAILGKDTNAAFYGITSLKHIFSQQKDGMIRSLHMEDYANVKTRGFIEGYYGNPWSHEDRLDLMTFGGDYKLNGYLYAPKDDPKHNSKWRELYTEEELEMHKELAEAGNASKCYYIYALHPFMYNAIRFDSDANYEADLQIIKDKFTQLMKVGVRQFSILADDAAVPAQGPETYVRLMEDLTDWLTDMQSEYPGLKKDMPFCPSDYYGWASSNEMQTVKNMPESVSIIQTGGRIWGAVEPEFNDTFYERMGRPAFMWINWPCSDNTKDGLIMGGALNFMKPNLNADTVDGIVLNPMQQSEPSKQAIFTAADYSWNIWSSDEHYDQVWNDSFAFIDHGTVDKTEASDALLELSKHMIYSRQVSGTHSEESAELRPLVNAFISELQIGTINEEKALELKNEFEILRNAARTYEAAGNERMAEQIKYWLGAWEDTTTAILNYLDAALLINDNASLSEIWDAFSAAQDAKEAAGTHALWYLDHYEYAVAGHMVVTPFMNNLDKILSDRVLPMINPNIKQEGKVYITNREDVPTGDTDNVLDNEASTEIVYKSPNSITEGTYVGVQFLAATDVNTVIFRLGAASNANDTFAEAKVQYTVDGKEWIDYSDELYTLPNEVILENMNLEGIKGVRMIATKDKSNTWLGVRDIVINPEEETEAPAEEITAVTTTDKLSFKQGTTIDAINDGSDSSKAWMAEDPYKSGAYPTDDSIPVDATVTLTFNAPAELGTIRMLQDGGDKLSKYAFEYTVDGEEWTELAVYNGDAEAVYEADGLMASAVRIRNLEDSKKWWILYDFSVTPKVEVTGTENLITNTNAAGVTVSVENGTAVLTASKDVTLEAGEYVGVDLGAIEELAGADKAEGLSVEFSRNGYEWTSEMPEAARYVRIINNSEEAAVLKAGNFAANYTVYSGPFLMEDLTDVGITSAGWASEDTRNNGAAFDGDVDTTTEFAVLPQAGTQIVYNLGQERSISSLMMVCQDTAVNYIRDAVIEVSNDLENWTTVVTIGDGVENTGDGNVSCKDANAGYIANSTWPNKVSVSGELAQPVTAKYLRIYFTASNNNRAVLFNEILINNGEYVAIPNAAVDTNAEEKQGYIPANMFDNSLTTSWTPATEDGGYLQYDFSENLEFNCMNIIQKGTPSNAAVKVRVVKDGEISWVNAGKLSHSLNSLSVDADMILSVRFEWNEGSAPMISEIICFQGEYTPVEVKTEELEKAIEEFESIDADEFVQDEKWDAFIIALEEARTVLKKAESQDEVDAALTKLRTAYTELNKKPAVATSDLETLVKSCEAIIKDLYEEDAAWAAYEKALAEAKAVLENPVSQEAVDAAKAALDAAIEALQPVIRDEVVIVYRAYNPNDGDHLYTENKAEHENAVVNGWNNEGIAWVAPVESDKAVMRLYDPNSGEHHYTVNKLEKETLVELGWRDEGTAWYSDADKNVEVYRLYNRNATGAGRHHYTVDYNEFRTLVDLGWTNEGVGFHAVSIN